MSQSGQSATFRDVRIMSALPPLADIDLRLTHVCCGPIVLQNLKAAGKPTEF